MKCSVDGDDTCLPSLPVHTLLCLLFSMLGVLWSDWRGVRDTERDFLLSGAGKTASGSSYYPLVVEAIHLGEGKVRWEPRTTGQLLDTSPHLQPPKVYKNMDAHVHIHVHVHVHV